MTLAVYLDLKQQQQKYICKQFESVLSRDTKMCMWYSVSQDQSAINYTLTETATSI